MMTRAVGQEAKTALSIISNFKVYGCNLYRLCTNQDIERMLGFNHSKWMRIKKQLRDAGLVDYDGNIGDLKTIIECWEDKNGQTWEYEL
jgi:hypothetical protein